MKCDKVKELLQDYLEKSLSDETAGKVGDHLESCHECRRELDEMFRYHSIMKSIPQKKAPEGFGGLVHNAIRVTDKKRKASSSGLLQYIKRWRMPLEAAGALAVAVTVILIYFPSDLMKSTSSGSHREIAGISSEHDAADSGKAGEAMGLKRNPARDRAPGDRHRKKEKNPGDSITHYRLSLRFASLPERGPIAESETAIESGKASGFSLSRKSVDVKEEKRALASADDISAGSPPSMPARSSSKEKLNEIRNLVSVLEGRIEAEKGDPATGDISSMTVILPGKNYLNFIYQLGKIGPVTDREKRDYREGNEVRVTILLDYRD